MTPSVALRRLIGCFLAGVVLGPFADAVRSPRRSVLSQLLIGLELTVCWLYTSFGLCRADLRIGFFLAMLAGFALWERLFGAAVTALFGKIRHFAVLPLGTARNFFRKIAKFLFSS